MVEFEDSALPVSVSLDAFTPFIPLNVDDSSLPVAIFKYRVQNRSAKARRHRSLVFSAQSSWLRRKSISR